jgi:hypothetical protein
VKSGIKSENHTPLGVVLICPHIPHNTNLCGERHTHPVSRIIKRDNTKGQ